MRMLARVVWRRPAVASPRLHHSLLSSSSSSTSCYHQDAAAAALPEYTATPHYPEILDVSPDAKRLRRQQEWHDKVTKLPTVEQKMMELNMPRYYGHWSCHLLDTKPMLGSAEFCQFATRTHLTEAPPHTYYSDVWGAAAAAVDTVAPRVEQLINTHYNTQLTRRGKMSPSGLKRRHTENFLLGLHRVLCGALQDTPHIRDATVDLRPRVEAYWILGSLPPDHMMKKTRRGVPWMKDKENHPMDRPMQGTSSPCLGVRVGEGLPEVVGRGDVLATCGKVPGNTVDPRCFGFRFKHKHATTVTGSWPSEGRQHGHLFVHTLDFEDHFKAGFGAHNLPDAFLHKAVLSCFTQAYAHATYLGFGPVTELTYPVVQQSAFSDGQRWTLALYQLNTCALHSDRPIHNPNNNILWLSEEQQLFEGVDEGGVKGLNTPLLTSLLAMYLKEGRPNPHPTPYLPLKHVANHPAVEEYRDAFHQYYLWLCSGRERSRPKPELYLWEKIYKVDFKMRPFEPPRRFFEDHYKKKDPGQQRLDEYRPPYIPKSLRTYKRVKTKPTLNTQSLYNSVA